jgi:alanine dehydrogenase
MVELTEGIGIYPKEALSKVKTSKNSLVIGLPKETELQEKRVVLTPEAVGLLVNNGQHVIVEANAGAKSKFTDKDYSDAGAKVVYSAKEAFDAEVMI